MFDLPGNGTYPVREVGWTRVPVGTKVLVVIEVRERKTKVGKVKETRRYVCREEGGRVSYLKPAAERAKDEHTGRYWVDETGCECWGYTRYEKCVHAETYQRVLAILEGGVDESTSDSEVGGRVPDVPVVLGQTGRPPM